MRISDRIRGTAELEISGVMPESLLNAAAGAGVRVWGIEKPDAYTLRLSCFERQLRRIEELARRCGCDCRVLAQYGGSRTLRFALRRRALLLGMLLATALLGVSSLFVWRVEVTGCQTLSRGELLRALEDCGVDVGCFWPGVDTERVRNEVMLKCPEIGWIGVNFIGSRAVVKVIERQTKPEIYRQEGTEELIAAKDGLVRRVSALNGNALVSPGQIVSAGQTLVSAQRESLSGGVITASARGSVMAETWTTRVAVCPAREQYKSAVGRGFTRFAVIFGKRRINLSFRTGKALDGYDKIVAEYTLGVKGLFSLPIRLVTERYVRYELREAESRNAAEMAQRLLSMQTLSTEGQLLDYDISRAVTRGLLLVTLRAHCIENIARTRQLPDDSVPKGSL